MLLLGNKKSLTEKDNQDEESRPKNNKQDGCIEA